MSFVICCMACFFWISTRKLWDTFRVYCYWTRAVPSYHLLQFCFLCWWWLIGGRLQKHRRENKTNNFTNSPFFEKKKFPLWEGIGFWLNRKQTNRNPIFVLEELHNTHTGKTQHKLANRTWHKRRKKERENTKKWRERAFQIEGVWYNN